MSSQTEIVLDLLKLVEQLKLELAASCDRCEELERENDELCRVSAQPGWDV